MPLVIAACAAAASLAGTARAQDNGIYLGGSIGRSSTDIGDAAALFDDEASAFKLVAGLRPLDWFGVEASYIDLGEVEQTQNVADFADFRFEQKGTDAFGVFFYDVALFDLFAKAGLVRWDIDGAGSTSAGRVDMSDDGTDFAWGVGAQVRLRSIAVRLEYERFEAEAFDGLAEKPEMLSVGMTWTFF
ncbi:MAG: outer membrane beta-barrel protein [Gammaproteobacteria bacterium]|nr:outer membrane beta-barrel protein [Gammaproteobacteria bacterium]